MKELHIGAQEAGQKLDRLLGRYLPEASMGFLYKMLRKKNITLNGKKATGSEKVADGDSVQIWFSEETLAKFSGVPENGQVGKETPEAEQSGRAGSEARVTDPNRTAGGKMPASRKSRELAGGKNHRPVSLDIVYEDEQILIVNKPAGMLSQKAVPTDVSLCEHLIDYLTGSGQVSQEQLRLFRPSVCNRLDRNTSGLVLCGKTVQGLQLLSELIRDRNVGKYYRCLVAGRIEKPCLLDAYLIKDEKTNQVRVVDRPCEGAARILTEYRPVKWGQPENMTSVKERSSKERSSGDPSSMESGRSGKAAVEGKKDGMPECTLLEVHLITGKSHQIRAHLQSIGHPILGDPKYGNARINEAMRRKAGLRRQLLHAARMEFPDWPQIPEGLRGACVEAPLPEDFRRCLKF